MHVISLSSLTPQILSSGSRVPAPLQFRGFGVRRINKLEKVQTNMTRLFGWHTASEDLIDGQMASLADALNAAC